MENTVAEVTQMLGYAYAVKQLPTDGGRWHGSCPTLGATWLVSSEHQGHELAQYSISFKLRELKQSDQPIPPPDFPA